MPASRRDIVLGMAAAGLVSLLSFFKTRSWYSSHDIFELADPTIMRDVEVAVKEIERWEERAEALRREQYALIASHGDMIDAAGHLAYAKLVRAELEAVGHSMMAREAHNRTLERALEHLYGKLRDGRLVARGRLAPAGARAAKTRIPAEHWETMLFNGDYYTGEHAKVPEAGLKVTYINLDYIGDYTGASNHNVRYVGVELGRS
jgi:hypothetical protein